MQRDNIGYSLKKLPFYSYVLNTLKRGGLFLTYIPLSKAAQNIHGMTNNSEKEIQALYFM